MINRGYRPRVLLADDHRLVAEGLKSLLTPEFELLDVVEDGRALVAAAKKLRPDVIVADISMPHLNGLDALAIGQAEEEVGKRPGDVVPMAPGRERPSPCPRQQDRQIVRIVRVPVPHARAEKQQRIIEQSPLSFPDRL